MESNNKRKAPENEEKDGDNESLKRSEEEIEKCKELMKASEAGDTKKVLKSLEEGADVHYRDELGRGPLHLAALNGHLETVKELLMSGHPWNELDSEGKCAGEYAEEGGQEEVYQFLLEEGCRVELLFNLMDRMNEDDEEEEEEESEENQEDGKEEKEEENRETKEEMTEEKMEEKDVLETKHKKKEAPNQDYLSQKLHYSDDKLLDEENNAVMMNWEGPLMEKHAELMCRSEGLDVINVGFGLGLIDDALQKYKPKTHTIIEAHPDVYARMIELGWDKKPGVRILFGRWQDVVEQLEQYDAIFFDTFGEFWQDLRQFCELVPNILKPDGIYSFFNGLGGSNPFFHAVYCRIAEMELLEMGMETTYVKVELEKPTEQVWDGVKRKYFTLTTYNLPICRLIDEV